MSIAHQAHASSPPGESDVHTCRRHARRGREGRLAAALIVIVAVALSPRPARADEAATLLAEGKKLMKEGKLEEACPKLEQSHKLSSKGTTLLELASCHEKQGKLATAWAEYIDVGAEARKEGNKRLQGTAKFRGEKLELRLPRLTLSVPAAAAVEGLELKLDGTSIDRSGWGQPRPIDPGSHTVSASAPGRKTWEFPVPIKPGDRKAVAVPVLAKDGSAEPEPAQSAAQTPPVAAPGSPPSAPVAAGADASSAPEPPPSRPASARRAGRYVVDVGVAGGLVVGLIDAGSLGNLSSYSYGYLVPDDETGRRELIAPCNDDVCHAGFDPGVGLFAGGQAFFGYALSEDLHLGARAIGGYRFGGDYLLVGGPSGSLRRGPLWLGLSLLVGGISQNAKVTGIKGEIPPEAVELNNGQTEVDITTRGSNLPESASVGTLAFGGSVEISYVLADFPSSTSSSGSLVVSVWPTFMKGLEGFVLAAPVSLGYRFH